MFDVVARWTSVDPPSQPDTRTCGPVSECAELVFFFFTITIRQSKTKPVEDAEQIAESNFQAYFSSF